MVKAYSCAFIFLLLLVPLNSSFAQVESGGNKIYSGYLHTYKYKTNAPFWHVLFSPFFPKQEVIDYNKKCLIIFKSPLPFSDQPVTEVPKELKYFVRLKESIAPSKDNSISNTDASQKFVINIYTDDDQEYTIDPATEGKTTRINSMHHISDSYLIYLVLGPKIERLELIVSSDKGQEKYMLDKFKIHNYK